MTNSVACGIARPTTKRPALRATIRVAARPASRVARRGVRWAWQRRVLRGARRCCAARVGAAVRRHESDEREPRLRHTHASTHTHTHTHTLSGAGRVVACEASSACG
eukprot:6200537-Pleurochrysis_carterae.AAC.2